MNAQALDRELLKLSLSPIAAYLDDPEVTDILVYGSRHVYVRRRGTGFESVGAAWHSDDGPPSRFPRAHPRCPAAR